MALDVPATETLRVSVDAARAEDFARETGFVDPAGDYVPISYPVRLVERSAGSRGDHAGLLRKRQRARA